MSSVVPEDVPNRVSSLISGPPNNVSTLISPTTSSYTGGEGPMNPVPSALLLTGVSFVVSAQAKSDLSLSSSTATFYPAFGLKLGSLAWIAALKIMSHSLSRVAIRLKTNWLSELWLVSNG